MVGQWRLVCRCDARLHSHSPTRSRPASVTDQERFSKEILGRWFKHQNFGSFVRQLNLYGFRKVPHLQQGALHSDTSQEPLCFENNNFHRGQPDLLHLISRKKQANPGREDGAGEKTTSKDTNTNGNAATSPRLLTSSNGALDVNNLLTGIAAIKRHQSQISNELNELKRNNQALWQEAIAARERYQRQQDTVERILKFLGSVFGNAPGANVQSKDASAKSASSSSIPRQPNRLLIEGTQGKPKTSEAGSSRFVEHPESPSTQDEDMEQYGTPNTVCRCDSHIDYVDTEFATPPPDGPSFASISAVTSPAATTPFAIDGHHGHDTQTPFFSLHANTTPASSARPNPEAESSNNSGHDSTAAPSTVDPALTSLVSTNGQGQAEPMMSNSMLAALLNSPGNFQRVLSALNTLSPVTAPSNETLPNGSDMALTQTGNSLPSPPHLNLDPTVFTNGWPSADSLAALDPPSSDVLSSSALTNNAQQLQKLADNTGKIDSHIDAMDTSIQSLLETLGVPADALNSQSQQDNLPFDHMDSNYQDGLDFSLLNPVASSGSEPFSVPLDVSAGDGMDWSTFFHTMDNNNNGPIEDDFAHFDSDAATTSPASTAPALEPVEPKVPAKRKAEAVEPPVDALKPKRSTRKKR